MIVDGSPDREITLNGKTFLYFGGTSYLGLTTHPEYQKNHIESIIKYGTAYGSSRNANIKLSVFNKAEIFFAELIGSEEALTFTSGTLAGKLVLECLTKSENTFYHYPKTHPAITHRDSLPVFVDGKLHPNLINNIKENIVITADAFLGLEVEPTDFDFLKDISLQKTITLVLDESHSLGIVGEHLKGVFNTISNRNLHRKIMVSSLGKALGLAGGIVAADSHFIRLLKNDPDFISSSGISPAYLETFIQSQEIIKSQRKKLDDNLKFLLEGLQLNPVFKFHKNYPVIYSEDESVFKSLYRAGIVITNFEYPTYKKPMNRIVITANHSQEDLIKLKQVLINFNNCF